MANFFFIGDSMIEFFDWRQRFPEHRIINLGRSGETAPELLVRLPAILDLQPPPDWLLFMTGTNDICMEDFSFPNTYVQIIKKCADKYPKTPITINSILPIGLPYLAANTVPRINSLLHELATTHGVNFLDGYTPLTDKSQQPLPGVLATDGVHLEEHGYQLWADEIEKHLPAILP